MAWIVRCHRSKGALKHPPPVLSCCAGLHSAGRNDLTILYQVSDNERRQYSTSAGRVASKWFKRQLLTALAVAGISGGALLMVSCSDRYARTAPEKFWLLLSLL